MDAKKKLIGGVALAVVVAGAGGFFGGHALGAAEKNANFTADAAEMTRTQSAIHVTLANAVNNLKDVAKGATLATAETQKTQREQAINEALRPVQEELFLLMLQTHLLCADNMADESPEQLRPFLQSVYDKSGVSAAEVEARQTATGLGHGSLLMGYRIAKESGKTPDEVFALKKDKSWAEVLRLTNVSVAKLGEGFK
jgi:hypothetical protein